VLRSAGISPFLYRQIYDRIRTSIADGKLRAGDKLPPSRILAAEFNVARGTVDAAYALLCGEGYAVSKPRSGMVVAPAVQNLSRNRASSTHLSMDDREDFTIVFEPPAPLMPGLPSFDLFPRKLWCRLVARQARRLDATELSYPDPIGSLRLRTAVTNYLAVSRGVRCHPDQVIITGGYLAAVTFLCQVLTKSGAKVLLETPGYNFTRRMITTLGRIPVDVRVDDEGLDIEFGFRTAQDAALCIVAPSYQFPLGVCMSLTRRLSLLDWASRKGGWIIEDDYGGEFRYDGWPLPALKSLDDNERVFYVGTFSKTLFPGLRLGYIVVPTSQLSRVRHAARRLEGGRPSLEQAVVAEFLEAGHFARHLKKMKTAYRRRKATLEEAVEQTLGHQFSARPINGGLNLLLNVAHGVSDLQLAARAAAAGLRPLALSPLGRSPLNPKGLLLGFGNLPETQALPTVRRLKSALGGTAPLPARIRQRS